MVFHHLVLAVNWVNILQFNRRNKKVSRQNPLGSRTQFNTLTGVIDGNTIYGVKEMFTRKLRAGFGGLLRMNPVFQEYGLKDLLPLKLDVPDEGCTRPNKSMFCFEAGLTLYLILFYFLLV